MPDIEDIWDDEEDMETHVISSAARGGKNATVNVHLSADSGYTSHETSRISADQWGRICAILNEATT